MALADRVAAEARAEDVDQIFVDSGAGAGVIDRLRQLGVDCVEVPFGGRPIDPQYKNKRAEMWGLMKKWLQEGGAIPDDDELVADLTGPETVPRLDGKIQLESKNDMKKRGIPSPNKGDASTTEFIIPNVGNNKSFICDKDASTTSTITTADRCRRSWYGLLAASSGTQRTTGCYACGRVGSTCSTTGRWFVRSGRNGRTTSTTWFRSWTGRAIRSAWYRPVVWSSYSK